MLTFEMLTGSMPYSDGTSMEIAYATLNEPIPSACDLNPILPLELDMLRRVLAKDPEERPATMRQLVAGLRRLPQRPSPGAWRPGSDPTAARAPASPRITLRAPSAPTAAESAGRHRALKLLSGPRRQAIVLKPFTESMDRVRDEHTHTWKQIDDSQFSLVHYTNLYALGRLKKEKACYVWTVSFESILRWAGLANNWYVEEIECGCMTGTFDCVFAIRSVRQ